MGTLDSGVARAREDTLARDLQHIYHVEFELLFTSGSLFIETTTKGITEDSTF